MLGFSTIISPAQHFGCCFYGEREIDPRKYGRGLGEEGLLGAFWIWGSARKKSGKNE